MNTSISWGIQQSHLLPKVCSLSYLLRRKQIPDRGLIQACQLQKLQNKLCLFLLQTEIRQKRLQYYFDLCIRHLPNIPLSMLRIGWLVLSPPTTERLIKQIGDNRAYLRQTHLSCIINTFTPISPSRRGCIAANCDKAIGIDSTSQVGIKSLRHRTPHSITTLPTHFQAGCAKTVTQWGGHTPKAGGRLLQGREWNEMPLEMRRK